MKKEICIGFDIDGVLTYHLTNNPIMVEKFANLIYKLKPFQKIVSHIYKNQKPNLEIINLISKLKEDNIKIVLVTGFQGDRELIIERLKQFNVKYDELYNISDKIDDKENNTKEYKIKLVKELELTFFIDDRKDIIDVLPEEIGIHYTTNSKLEDIEKKIFERITEIKVLWELKTTEKFNELRQKTQQDEKKNGGSAKIIGDELSREVQDKEEKQKKKEWGDERGREIKREFKIR